MLTNPQFNHFFGANKREHQRAAAAMLNVFASQRGVSMLCRWSCDIASSSQFVILTCDWSPSWVEFLTLFLSDCLLHHFHCQGCPYLHTHTQQTHKRWMFVEALKVFLKGFLSQAETNVHKCLSFCLGLTGAAAAELILWGGRVRGGHVQLCRGLSGEIGGKHSTLPI